MQRLFGTIVKQAGKWYCDHRRRMYIWRNQKLPTETGKLYEMKPWRTCRVKPTGEEFDIETGWACPRCDQSFKDKPNIIQKAKVAIADLVGNN